MLKKLNFSVFIPTILSLIIVTIITHLWQYNIHIPFDYNSDAPAVSHNIKTILDTGWYIHNSYLGAPGGYNFADYPMSDNLSFLIIKGLGSFSHNFAVVLNSYYLLCFCLISISALFVLRRLQLNYYFALVASLLFTFLPYHFLRGESHLFLSAYYSIPLTLYIILSLADTKLSTDNQKWLILFKTALQAKFLIPLLIIGASNIYYAFFTICFLFAAGIIVATNNLRLYTFKLACCLIALTIVIITINFSPSIYSSYKNNNNFQAINRSPVESEIYGLRMTQLLFPIEHNRIKALANFSQKYNSSASHINENASAALGIIAGIGFLLLVFSLFSSKLINDETFHLISKLNIFAVLLGTIGGFGAVFAYLLMPQIRGYNRISVYIGFFSLYAFFYLLQQFIKHYISEKLQNKTIAFVGTFVLLLGLYTQTSASFILNKNGQTVKDFQNDASFIKKIESTVPSKTQIFELPYVEFPEPSNAPRTDAYFLIKPYLHSKQLIWSYGAMKGSNIDYWQMQLSQMPISDMLNEVIYSGFRGLYINCVGYADKCASIEPMLNKILSTKPITDESKKQLYYDLYSYAQQLQATQSATTWSANLMRVKFAQSLRIAWSAGIFQLEKSSLENWRWSDNNTQLIIFNSLNQPVKAKISFGIASQNSQLADFIISGNLFGSKLSYRINNQPTWITKEVWLAPGKNGISFFTTAERVYAPKDSRIMYFRIIDFNLKAPL